MPKELSKMEHFGIPDNFGDYLEQSYFSKGQEDLFMLLGFWDNFLMTFTGNTFCWSRRPL
jgi:hypothetical protein